MDSHIQHTRLTLLMDPRAHINRKTHARDECNDNVPIPGGPDKIAAFQGPLGFEKAFPTA
jgi:hypothetical protein